MRTFGSVAISAAARSASARFRCDFASSLISLVYPKADTQQTVVLHRLSRPAGVRRQGSAERPARFRSARPGNSRVRNDEPRSRCGSNRDHLLLAACRSPGAHSRRGPHTQSRPPAPVSRRTAARYRRQATLLRGSRVRRPVRPGVSMGTEAYVFGAIGESRRVMASELNVRLYRRIHRGLSFALLKGEFWGIASLLT